MAVSSTSVSIGTTVNLPVVTTPSAPSAGTTVYSKSDGRVYVLPAGGSESKVMQGNEGDLRLRSTGVYTSVGITKTSSTQVTIGAVTGEIVSNTGANAANPIATQISYAGVTGFTPTNLATADATYILINSSGTIVELTTFPTPSQRRANIWIGKIAHPDRSTILAVDNITDYDISPMSVIRDMYAPIRYINDGVVVSPNGSNLNLNLSAGNLYGVGINFVTDATSPNKVAISSASPMSFYYRTQTGGNTGSVSSIVPGSYDVGGVVTAISATGDGGGNKTTNQRIYLYPTGVVNIQYGQTVYSSLASALAAQQTETFVKAPNVASTAILIGLLAVRRTATSLADSNYAVFTPASMFGENIGGVNGISTTTLQQAYNNSVTPEIITDATRGALTVKQGSGADTDPVYEVQNGSGTVMFFTRGDGISVGHSVEMVPDTYSTSQVLTIMQCKVYFTGTSVSTFTLTAANVVGGGVSKSVRIANNGTANLTITRAGSDTISKTLISFILYPGESVILESDGVSNWTVF